MSCFSAKVWVLRFDRFFIMENIPGVVRYTIVSGEEEAAIRVV